MERQFFDAKLWPRNQERWNGFVMPHIEQLPGHRQWPNRHAALQRLISSKAPSEK
jgi:hypothetical protein